MSRWQDLTTEGRGDTHHIALFMQRDVGGREARSVGVVVRAFNDTAHTHTSTLP